MLFRLERAVRPLSTFDNRAALSFPAVLVARCKAPVPDLTASLVPAMLTLDVLAAGTACLIVALLDVGAMDCRLLAAAILGTGPVDLCRTTGSRTAGEEVLKS